MNTNKAKYRILCEEEKSIPINSHSKFLDAICGDDWDVCIVEQNNEIVASLPYLKVYNRLGMLSLVNPPESQYLGPWIKNKNLSSSKKLSKEKSLITELIAQLPKYDCFNQTFHYNYTNWLPFYWNDFKQTTRYTYILNNLNDLDHIFANFTSSYRNKIKNANEKVKVCDDMNITQFYKINQLTFKRQGVNLPYSLDFLRKKDQILVELNRRKIFYAIDKNNQIHSAIYLTWDNNSSYLHMIGEDPELRNSGAGILLVWHAIKFTSEILKLSIFDFEGSMLENVEHVRRDFGAIQTPFFAISKINSKLLKVKLLMNEIL